MIYRIIYFFIYIFLTLIYFKFIGYYSIIAALLTTILILLIDNLVFFKIRKETLEKINGVFYEFNAYDLILYKILGNVFLNFRKKYEHQFEQWYINIGLMNSEKIMIYLSGAALIIILAVVFMAAINQRQIMTITENTAETANIQKHSDNSKKLKAPVSDTLTDSEIEYGKMLAFNHPQYLFGDTQVAKKFFINEFQKYYGDKWQTALIAVYNYFLEKNINRAFTDVFTDSATGTINFSN